MAVLPKRVKELREKRRMSQRRLAARLRELGATNVQQQHISQVERGEAREPHYLRYLPEALGTTLEYLCGESDDENATAVNSRLGNVKGESTASGKEVEDTKGMAVDFITSMFNAQGKQLGALDERLKAVETVIRQLLESQAGAPEARPRKGRRT